MLNRSPSVRNLSFWLTFAEPRVRLEKVFNDGFLLLYPLSYIGYSLHVPHSLLISQSLPTTVSIARFPLGIPFNDRLPNPEIECDHFLLNGRRIFGEARITKEIIWAIAACWIALIESKISSLSLAFQDWVRAGCCLLNTLSNHFFSHFLDEWQRPSKLMLPLHNIFPYDRSFPVLDATYSVKTSTSFWLQLRNRLMSI